MYLPRELVLSGICKGPLVYLHDYVERISQTGLSNTNQFMVMLTKNWLRQPINSMARQSPTNWMGHTTIILSIYSMFIYDVYVTEP